MSYGLNPAAIDQPQGPEESLKRLAMMLRDIGYGGLESALRRLFGGGLFFGPGRRRGGAGISTSRDRAREGTLPGSPTPNLPDPNVPS